MKKINVLCLGILIIFCLVLSGCEKEIVKFYLEDEYYDEGKIVEIDNLKFSELVENKESFVVFIYQPMCAASISFEGVLGEFIKEYSVNIFKMSFSDMGETNLGKKIKYYPSFVVYNNGEMIDYLDANSGDDSSYYKSLDGFSSWFFKYILIDTDENIEEYGDEDNKVVSNDIKIDVELDGVTYDSSKVNIYLFWGEGCPHCEKLKQYLNSIKDEYGKYFNLHSFEVWYDDDNLNIYNQFASKMGDKTGGVPYMIIGNKSFSGFGEDDYDDVLNAIVEQHNNSYDIYFDNK